MSRRFPLAALVAVALSVSLVAVQNPPAKQVAQERAQAELDAPKLADVLELTPGMTVADVGAGFGALTVVFAKRLAPGRVFATDIGERQLAFIRDYVQREGLTNVTVLEGAPASTNLPAACCDAIFLRDVYHHLTAPEPFNRSLHDSLKPGGRLAIIDFLPRGGSARPEGVPADRGGHGVTPEIVVKELAAAGFNHLRTIERWPPGDNDPDFFLVLFRKTTSRRPM